MDTTRHEFDQAVLDRARSWGRAMRLGGHARSAPTCSDRPASATAGLPADPEVRVAIAGHGVGYVLVEVAGAVDIACRPELTEVLGRAVDSGRPAVIVDLSAVTLLAAAGFWCLQGVADLMADRNGHLHVVCPPASPAARALRILDPDGWRLHPDVVAAVATVGTRA